MTNPNRLILILSLLVVTMGFSQEKEGYIEKLEGSDLTIHMVAIPQGSFKLGSPPQEEGRDVDEGPERAMEINGFWMSEHEITWQLYNLFLQRSIDGIESDEKGSEVDIPVDAVAGATVPYVDMSLGMGTGEELPVVNVTQLAASKFCEWLSAKTGHFYRLPTEAEWEYAASAGNETPYFYGEDASELEKYAWFKVNSGGFYHKVGEKDPNAWELYDMYGNVAEWTLDQYKKDAYKESDNYFIPVESEYPVAVRGGSFKDEAHDLRSASRMASKPVWKQRDPQFPRSKWWHTDAAFVGFRIVRPFDPPPVEEQQEYWIKEK